MRWRFEHILFQKPLTSRGILQRLLRVFVADGMFHWTHCFRRLMVLGAWVLGWEIWMDVMEITLFTYFPQARSLPLSSIYVEITYGLEHILMLLQWVAWEMEITRVGNHQLYKISSLLVITPKSPSRDLTPPEIARYICD